MAELIEPDETWSLTHPNGTYLEGKVGSPGRGGEGYAYWRRDGYYRPFPDGIYPAVNPVGLVLQKGIIVGLANHTVLVARDGTRRPIADSGLFDRCDERLPRGVGHGSRGVVLPPQSRTSV